MGKVAIEAEVLAELDKLIGLVKRLISGESMEATPLVEFSEGKDSADLASLFDAGQEFIFIDSHSDQPLENYIEIRSTLFPEMAISLPRPAFTRVSEQQTEEAALAKWREDLC